MYSAATELYQMYKITIRSVEDRILFGGCLQMLLQESEVVDTPRTVLIALLRLHMKRKIASLFQFYEKLM
jgi:hypothetical protein